MNRKKRTIVVLFVSILVASAASYFVYGAVSSIPVREVEVKNYYVAVAAKPLAVGSMVQESDVKLVAWPASSPVAGGYSKVEEVVNRGLVAPVVENEPLTSAKLAVPEAGAGLPPTIATGMRAISVKVNEVIGVAGFVVPGTRVDVVVTIGRRDDSTSRVIVSNVQVLTAGTKFDQEQAKDGKPVPSTVVTLLVTPPDAERIALASSEGSIMLALRNPLDSEATDTKGTRLASLMGAPDPAPVVKLVKGTPKATPPPAPPAPAPTIYSVETIRAAKRVSEVVK
ncbi:MAG TPA: Flp pilus assembly protein CpaB [Vicinamibacterales bacterium]|nr:Flp pilus assembly protein CpaB [Vicinamibacterales bacterium]